MLYGILFVGELIFWFKRLRFLWRRRPLEIIIKLTIQDYER